MEFCAGMSGRIPLTGRPGLLIICSISSCSATLIWPLRRRERNFRPPPTARAEFPAAADRLRVVEVSVLLRQGRTEEVENILEGRDLSTDMQAQAMLLQLAMTYDAMGNEIRAMERYQKFLELNRGREITDPDVLRYFASAALRLSMILTNSGEFQEAAQVVQLVINTTDDDYLKRRFTLEASQIAMDQALTQSGNAREASLAKAKELAEELIWGATDNFFYMGMALRSWAMHLQGESDAALQTIRDVRRQAVQLEESMEEQEVPKSEFPRPALRLVEGIILWDQAKSELAEGNEQQARRLGAQAAGHFYNTFLNYEGNAYADRAAMKFEELQEWVKEAFGTEIRMGEVSPRIVERMFKRQLDLSRNLFMAGQVETAEIRLLEAFGQYPDTRYTLTALDILSRIWISQEKAWELMAIAGHIADLFADDEDAARIMLRIGRTMADAENLFGVDQVLGAFGRNFPSHPSAPAMLFRIGNAAAERGERGLAMEAFDDLLELYPQSNFAVTVLQMRGDEAFAAENYDEAVTAFTKVRDQARNPLQAAFARLRIADIQVASRDEEMEAEALEALTVLRSELEDPDSVFNEPQNQEQAQRFLRNVRYRTGQLLLRKAGREGTAEVRSRAARELNSFLEAYPDASQAPDVMFNLGRLYLQQQQFDRATQTFDDLAARYPDSDAGRDALFSLVRAALEEGQVEVAQQAVQRMVEQPTGYSVEQIFQVAQLMLNNERWTEAASAYALVTESERLDADDPLRLRSLHGKGLASKGEGDLDQAVESFQALIDDFPNSAMVFDAGISMAEAFLAMDPPQAENARQALSHPARILRGRPDKIGRVRLDIASGHVSMAEGEPGAALATWYGVGLSEPDSEELGALVRTAIQLALDRAQVEIREGNNRRWNLVIDLTNQYLNNFPMDAAASEMRSLNIRAIGNAP